MTAEFIVAVHALVYLNHKKTYASSEEIAENVCTNPARIRKVMSKLRNVGLADVKVGSIGGYIFCGDADKVTLYDILNATDKSIVSVSWRSGNECADCPVSKNMKPVMDDVFEKLDISGKETLEKITVEDIDKMIFPL